MSNAILPAWHNRTGAISPLLADPDITEIAINGPTSVFALRRGARFMEPREVGKIPVDVLEDIARLVAHESRQNVSEKAPLLSASISSGLTGHSDYRFQYVQAPAVPHGTVSITIRKPSPFDMDIDYWAASGAFDRINMPLPEEEDLDAALSRAFDERNWPQFLRLAIKAKKNILVTAPTNVGKTSFINMLCRLIGEHERIVTIQDALELQLRQRNVVNLIFSRGNQGVSKVSPSELMEATLRMTPDRVIPGELRGAEAFVALEMLNTGHGGWMTTMHSNSPEHMWGRLADMVMRAGTTMLRAEIIDYARGLIDVVIQMHRFTDGVRGIREIYFAKR
ncbi:P-type DNA transfer ATPase VirB11 [Burkholderia contaminans]|uniref:P-type DNA transfer ATPase VirB11 n=1 Tax=Burkholderia contaminans TaxID=488447 RepID=UPI001F148E03|nr:P-type DNA transfer ATPase VirB11 [Burkholderia contaminans]UMY33519.1 P-type DNA transfer ATPase VirB11 [Burkholderia contaminans]